MFKNLARGLSAAMFAAAAVTPFGDPAQAGPTRVRAAS